VKPLELRVRDEEHPNSVDLTPKLQKTPTATRAGTSTWQSPRAATEEGKSQNTTENPPVKHVHVDEVPSTADLLPKKQKNPSTMHNGTAAIQKTTFKTRTGLRILCGTREHSEKPNHCRSTPKKKRNLELKD
jgi:hypothetical protein